MLLPFYFCYVFLDLKAKVNEYVDVQKCWQMPGALVI